MADEFELKGKVRLDTSELEKLPEAGEKAAKDMARKVSKVGLTQSANDAKLQAASRRENVRKFGKGVAGGGSRAAKELSTDLDAVYTRQWRNARKLGLKAETRGEVAARLGIAATERKTKAVNATVAVEKKDRVLKNDLDAVYMRQWREAKKAGTTALTRGQVAANLGITAGPITKRLMAASTGPSVTPAAAITAAFAAAAIAPTPAAATARKVAVAKIAAALTGAAVVPTVKAAKMVAAAPLPPPAIKTLGALRMAALAAVVGGPGGAAAGGALGGAAPGGLAARIAAAGIAARLAAIPPARIRRAGLGGAPLGGGGPRPPGARPTAVGGASGSLGAGLFRGFATAISRGTGVGVPFLSLSPTFIAASVAASAFVMVLKQGLSAVHELASGITNLRMVSGGSLRAVADLASATRQFGVDAPSTAAGVQSLMQGVTDSSPAFKMLGIDIRDSSGNLKDGTALMKDAQKVISSIKDPAQQAAAAYGLFGTNYAALMPFLRQTPAVMKGNEASIKKQTEAALQAVAADEAMARNAVDFDKAKTGFFEGLGTKIAAGLDMGLQALTAVGEARDRLAARVAAQTKATQEGLSKDEIKLAGDTAEKMVQAQQDAARATAPRDVGVSGIIGSTQQLAAIASSAIEARNQVDSLNQSLLAIGQQRLQIAFQIGMAEKQIANTQFEQQQALANEAQDRAMQLAEQIAALTITLNEFRAAEQSAAIRAREQEKSFFAFRPDNALVRANQEIRFQRDRAQEIARNERLNEVAALNLANQREIADFELANLNRQETVAAQALALYNLTHPDVILESDRALVDLQRATIEAQTAAGLKHMELDITVNAADFTAEENARIKAIILQTVGEAAGQAISIVRAQSKRVPVPGRVGGPQ